MPSLDLEIKPFDLKNARESEYAILNQLGNRLRAESWPEDPPRTLDETIREARSIPPFVDVKVWAAWRGVNEMVAMASVALVRMETNQHIAEAGIEVVPEMRRQGIAKQFLPLITEVASNENRRLLMVTTDSMVPAGEIFAKRLGAQLGITSRTNQLNLVELDRERIHQWIKHGEERASDFELGLWTGSYPEEELTPIINLWEVMNSEPRDDLDVEDWHWTPERIRQHEASLAHQKTERWSLYVRDKKSGHFAGFTEVFWNPAQPETMRQGATGVFPEYRNKGLGRWLKATMLEKILCERPQVKRVRTGNANSNAPMLKINTELGFKPYKSWSTWQIELDKLEAYLREK
jgi:GNAT superfamily N-acetyltransferase